MKIGLLGCGAMGSLYGGYLSQAHDVYVCDVWKEHIEAIRANGIQLDEPDGHTAVFTPKLATTDPNDIGPVDLMIVFVKYMLLADGLRNAKAMIGKDTIVLSLQNGIGNYDEIAKVVPEEQICCGTTAHGCTFLGPGHVRHTGVGITNVGTLKGPYSNAQKVAEALRQGGFQAEAHENVMQLIWHKLFTNVSVSALTGVLQMKMGYMLDDAHGWWLCERLIREAVAVANGDGMGFDAGQIVDEIRRLLVTSHEGYTSIYADLRDGRRTEVDTISGAVVSASHRNGVPAPSHEFIVHLVHAMEGRAAYEG